MVNHMLLLLNISPNIIYLQLQYSQIKSDDLKVFLKKDKIY